MVGSGFLCKGQCCSSRIPESCTEIRCFLHAESFCLNCVGFQKKRVIHDHGVHCTPLANWIKTRQLRLTPVGSDHSGPNLYANQHRPVCRVTNTIWRDLSGHYPRTGIERDEMSCPCVSGRSSTQRLRNPRRHQLPCRDLQGLTGICLA